MKYRWTWPIIGCRGSTIEHMNYTLYHLVGAVCLGGTIGGLLNSMLAGPLTPAASKSAEFDPAYLKNIFTGMVAGFISWLPNLASFANATHTIVPADMIGACGSTILVGISGAKWIAGHGVQQKLEDDKIQLKSALVEAARKAPDPAAAKRLAATCKVADMISIVQSLKDS
jgi:hypothetical protein